MWKAQFVTCMQPYIANYTKSCSFVHHTILFYDHLLLVQVWANIQDYEDPSRIVFDLDNSKHWKSLFSSDMQQLTTVQVDILEESLLL